jgi:hypothetical protein
VALLATALQKPVHGNAQPRKEYLKDIEEGQRGVGTFLAGSAMSPGLLPKVVRQGVEKGGQPFSEIHIARRLDIRLS